MFETEIAQFLEMAGYFVRSNTVIKDTYTGKDREIDILAEYYSEFDRERAKAQSRMIYMNSRLKRQNRK